ncbi:16S rRNA (uracil(1498)-N(3))-methyltransferase [Moraxella nasovis]|uniref:16S rRNA (uracil(1498)-N(3))-methyltransferase n=1 Tax=Moraxella nasovis TaxID=2904121 RepID=UPI001F6212BC|nr:16S rRNA (uracil(1498)-N(3))-methyltransferase [Moraxella nasovis]UNU73630.1 16S rRNA (uracil(1498)-N(3))-methyltransferase [Moraxella nasovis]
MSRFFVDLPLTVNQSLTLPDDVYHHWCKVLRAKIGDAATLFNGQGGEYTAVITDIDKRRAVVMLTHFNPNNRTTYQHITLAQAMSKGERMDYTIQKACEMGVFAIQLIITERSERLRYERDLKKLSHWQAVAISACEQCGLNIIPKILPPVELDEFLANCHDTLKLVMALSSDKHVYTPAPLPNSISILIGPEGGLSENEIAKACSHGFLTWTLGERILRTETAGIVTMASLFMIDHMTS